jgi:hypothetical protein
MYKECFKAAQCGLLGLERRRFRNAGGRSLSGGGMRD